MRDVRAGFSTNLLVISVKSPTSRPPAELILP
jgi:hypothetical protein